METIAKIILLLLICISTVSALRCLRCDQADNAKCTDIQVCQVFPSDPDSTEVCQNDYRIVNNKVTIRKKCKQRKACLEEENLPDNNCDAHGGRNTVCRCCCDTDFCNKKKKGCVYPSDCEKPPAPENGSKNCPAAFRVRDKCTFKCNQGYILKGNKQTTCTRLKEDGTLGLVPPKIPICVRKIIRCIPEQTDPDNGKVFCQNTEEFEEMEELNYEGSRCRFECDKHFALVGAERLTCKSVKGKGKWSAKAPKCVRWPCPALTIDENRIDTCSAGKLIGSECSFECKKGYKLIGRDNNKCIPDPRKKNAGKWSRPPPKCVQIYCQPVQVDPSHGSVSCTNKNLENSVCTFECDDGYDMDETAQKTKRITCLDDNDGDALGSWTGTAPSCSIMKCLPQITALGNGKVKCTNKNYLGSVCTYTCDDGYDIVGITKTSTKAICRDDGDGDSEGEWTQPPPKCIVQTCEPERTDPENGEVVCSNGNRIGSVCKYKCDKFYDLDDTAKETRISTCKDDLDGDELGEWDGPPGTCTLKTCEPPHVDPKNGEVSCTFGNRIASRCTFECDEGYDLIGKPVSSCLDLKLDGDARVDWSSKAPTCKIGECKLPKIDPDELVRTCGDGDGVRIVVGTICTYKCKKEGHYMTPSDNRNRVINERELDAECQSDKTWSRDPPKCYPVKCQPPMVAPKNGNMPEDCTDGNRYGSRCTFECDEGYDIKGTTDTSTTTLCEDDEDGDDVGKWSKDPPTCVVKICNPPHVDPENGKVDCSKDNFLGSVCTFVCDENYDLDGTAKETVTSKCVDDGTGDEFGVWDGPAATCTIKTCVPPHGDPDNGEVSCTLGNRIGSRCTFVCDKGYDLIGEPISSCQDVELDGDAKADWTSKAPTCKIGVCKLPEIDPDELVRTCGKGGNVRIVVGSVCTYKCKKEGHYMTPSGNSNEVIKERSLDAECQFDKTWSRDPPNCFPVKCQPPMVAPKNGNMPEDCTDGNRYGSRCTFECDEGYDIKGTTDTSTTTLCEDDEDGDDVGKWSEDPPTCVVKICIPPHVDPENGKVDCSKENLLGSVCTFVCDDNYDLDGTAKDAVTSKCVDDGTGDEFGVWDGPAATCTIKTCVPPHEDPDHGEVSCTLGNRVGSRCEFVCDRGYDLIGEPISACQDLELDGDAKADWTSKAPICKIGVCKLPEIDPNELVRTCGKGGNVRIVVGSVCTYKCKKEGHYMTPSDNSNRVIKERSLDAECQYDKTWSKDPPKCFPVKCQPPMVAPKNGNMPDDCTDSNRYGSLCKFECDEGYDIKGTTETSTTTLCEDDEDGDDVGKWSKDPPTCVVIICNPPHVDPENGQVDCSKENFLGSVCTFVCDEDYDLDGTAKDAVTSKCVDDGTGDEFGVWDGPAATCTIKTCVPPHKNPANGEVSCTVGNRIGSRCNFKCDRGYDLIGIPESTCEDREQDGDSKGEWSSKAPICKIGACQLPKLRDDLVRTCGGESDRMIVGTVCNYKCKEAGHYMTRSGDQKVVILKGELDAECLYDKTWSEDPPNCYPMICEPEFGPPDNGFMPVCTAANKVGSVCTFRCKDRYKLSHERDPLCESDGDFDQFGKWNDTKPTCELNECDDFGQVKFGVIKYTDGFKIGSVGHLTCDERYTTKKYENITCIPADRRIKIPHWDRRKYVCCVRCDFNSYLRFVMVVDKTMSQDERSWAFVVDFMQYVLYYLDGKGYDITFGLVLYGETVDEKFSIPLRRITGWEVIDELMELMFDMPYGGEGSDTAGALTYTRETMFSSKTREEPYITLLSKAPVGGGIIDAAQEIRDKDISVLSVGFSGNRKSAAIEDRVAITGQLQNIFDINSPSQIADFNGRLTKISMDNGCSQSSKTSRCPR